MDTVTIATHNGGFHSDDVFAVATLKLFLGKEKDIRIVRTRDMVEIEKADFVVDVGGVLDEQKKRFDHHQREGAGEHPNGIPYASFGLVWKEYGAVVAGSPDVAKTIEDKLVLFVDALDNGMDINTPLIEDVRPYTISDYFYSFWIDEHVGEEQVDQVFLSMVDLAQALLVREIEKARHIFEDGKLVEEIYNKTEDKRVIVLDENIAWGAMLVKKLEPLFVVYPAIDGTRWNAKAVRIRPSSFEYRKVFPEAWGGKSGDDLVAVSGVKDAQFCHRARFLAVATTKEGALELVSKTLLNL